MTRTSNVPTLSRPFAHTRSSGTTKSDSKQKALLCICIFCILRPHTDNRCFPRRSEGDDVSEIRNGFAIVAGPALRRPRPRALASDRISRCSALSLPPCGATGSPRPAPFVPAARPLRSRLRLAPALGRRFAPTAPRPPPAPRASECPAARFAWRAPPSPRMPPWQRTRRRRLASSWARPPARRSRMPSCVSSSTGAARDARCGCRTTPRWARAR